MSPSISGDNLYASGDVLLYLVDDPSKIKMYYRMANIETKYALKILRVSVIKLNVDVSLGDKLLSKEHELAIVHFPKVEKLNKYRTADVLEFLNFVKSVFNSPLSSKLLEEIPATRIINKLKKSIAPKQLIPNKPIYWKELTYKFVYMIEELKKHHIDIVIDVERLTYSNNKFIWKWIK